MKRTIYFKNQPKIIATSTIAGPKESNGSIKKYFEIKLSIKIYFIKRVFFIDKRQLKLYNIIYQLNI